ncbi:MAG: ABC transporter ATP-binding protein [Chitinispirillaceae bacterium]
MNKRTPVIELENVHAAYEGEDALSGVSLTVEKSSRWAVIGPNGAGKSTLVKVIAGFEKATCGSVQINGLDINCYSSRKRAQTLAYMPQKPEGVIPYSVHDFIMLGRYCTMGLLGVPSPADRQIVAEAMDICNVGHLAMRLMSTLSGGELQRVLLAGAVAQAAPLLLLDEPTTFLDPAHEHLFFEALSRLHARRDLTIVMITHDINNALLQCTHVAALQAGKLLYTGTSGELREQCPGILRNLFGVNFNAFFCHDREPSVYGTWRRYDECR